MNPVIKELKNLLEHMAQSLCDYPENLSLEYQSMATLSIKFEVICNEKDKPHLIGKRGSNAQAMRTILHSTAAKDGWKTYISIN